MRRGIAKLFTILMAVLISAGCATARSRRAEPASDLSNQITQLHSELEAKDQKIAELQSRVDSYQRALQSPTTNISTAPRIDKSSIIHVTGVSATDLQQALVRAGLDPGPVDGRIGKKTKAAVKEFQRRNNLTPDGVVGQKTWSLLSGK